MDVFRLLSIVFLTTSAVVSAGSLKDDFVRRLDDAIRDDPDLSADDEVEYAEYCQKFVKMDGYSDRETDLKEHYRAYEQTKAEVEQLNAGATHEDEHYSINFFADMTMEEKLEWLVPLDEDDRRRRLGVEQCTTVSHGSLPTDAASRSDTNMAQGACGSVKNQGALGTCWAFASTGQLQCNYNDKMADNQVFSEKYATDCSDDSIGTNSGGWMHQLTAWYDDNGACTSFHKSYDGSDQNNYNGDCGCQDHKKYGECHALYANNDAAVIAAAATEHAWDFAVGLCNSFFSADSVWYGCAAHEPLIGGHAMVIVGQEHGEKMLVRNSWGSGWGMSSMPGHVWFHKDVWSSYAGHWYKSLPFTRTEFAVDNILCDTGSWNEIKGSWSFDAAECSIRNSAGGCGDIVWFGSADGKTPDSDFDHDSFVLTTEMEVASGGYDAGIMFRTGESSATNDEGPTYYVGMYPGYDYVVFGSMDDGWYPRHWAYVPGLEYNTVHTLSVHGAGNVYSVYVDGAAVITDLVRDEFSFGSVGLRTCGAPTTYHSLSYEGEDDASWQMVLDLQPTTVDVGQAAFNQMFWNSKYPILKRVCNGCGDSHKEIFYKRLTNSHSVDLYSYTYDWRSTGNVLGVDFNLYSTFDDAVSGLNPWKYCNYDDPNIGMFRDCGPNGYVAHEWTSRTRGGDAASFYIYTDEVVLSWLGWSPGTELGECEGDCDYDSDCIGTLLCYHDGVPPGCSGMAYHYISDYCYDPSNDAAAKVEVASKVEVAAPADIVKAADYFGRVAGIDDEPTPWTLALTGKDLAILVLAVINLVAMMAVYCACVRSKGGKGKYQVVRMKDSDIESEEAALRN